MTERFLQAKGMPAGYKPWLNPAPRGDSLSLLAPPPPLAAAVAVAASAGAGPMLSARRSRRDKASSPLPAAHAAAPPPPSAIAAAGAGPAAISAASAEESSRRARLADWKSSSGAGSAVVRAAVERSVFGRTGLRRNGTVRPPDGFDFGSNCFVCNLEDSAMLFCDYSGCSRRYHQVRGRCTSSLRDQ
jgi:hypothetical protein